MLPERVFQIWRSSVVSKHRHDLTVILFKWSGWRGETFQAWNVNAVCRMLKHHLRMQHRVVCVTDDPTGVQCDTFPLWDDPIVTKQPTPHANWRRLKLFSEWAAREWPGWVLVLDVDVVILADITDLITWDELRILKGAVSPYRTGMWLHKTGTRTHVWDTFDPETSPFEIPKHGTKTAPWVGSDQGWVSVTCERERLYTAKDGVYAMRCRTGATIPKGARVVLTMGEIKPWHDEARKRMPQLWESYMKWAEI